MSRRRTARIATLAAVLAALPAPATADVRRAETILPPGQSGYVPLEGGNSHLTDQLVPFERFELKPAGFDEPGVTEAPRRGVTIRRDAFGVPNVRGATDADVWFGAGYATAQDRLVQLELFRRATQGRLAEVLGEERLADDVVARRDYYTRPELRRMLRRLPRDLRGRWDAYADGVNARRSRLCHPAIRVVFWPLSLASWTSRMAVK